MAEAVRLMIGRFLAKLAPPVETTDPEIIEHHRREARERKGRLETFATMSREVTNHLIAVKERNHFGPDIDAAIHLGKERRA